MAKKSKKSGRLIQFPERALLTQDAIERTLTSHLDAFAAALGLTSEARAVGKNPNYAEGEGWRDPAHWLVTLKLAKRKFETYYTQNREQHGDTPPALGPVLACLGLDARTIEEHATLETWADSFGYVLEEDGTRPAEVYAHCKQQTAKLKKFLGAPAFATLLEESVK